MARMLGVAALAALMALAPATAYADERSVACTLDGATLTVEIANPAGAPVLVGALPSGEIAADGVPCGGATVTNTDVVAVHVTSGTAGLDLATPLAPGLTPEAGGLSTIEVEWYGGTGLAVYGGAGSDDFRVVAGGLHLDGDTDVDLTFGGAMPADLALVGGEGDDVLDASAAPAATHVSLDGGSGDDYLHGHAGVDVIDGGPGADRVADGAGADVVTTGDGDDAIGAGLATYAAETATPLALPDQGVVNSSLTVPADLKEYDVEVRVTLAHTDVSQLNLQLQHGFTIVLAVGGGAPGESYAGALFHDGASRLARDVPGVRTGRFRPSSFTFAQLLHPLGGKAEPWTLRVNDTAADGRAGTLLGWSVHVVGAPGSWATTGPSYDAADTYDGGAGRDALSYAPRGGAVTLDATAEWGPAGEAGEGDAVHYPTFERFDTGFGDDVITGSARDEDLHAGAGADTLRGNGGSDGYDCGDSYPVDDVVSFTEAAGPLRIDLAAGTVTGDGSDTISGCETVYGTAAGDTFVGTDANETFYGLGGADTMTSGSGGDRLYGGDGDDTFAEGDGWGSDLLDGGPGFDTADYRGRGGYRVVIRFDGAANDGVGYPAEGDQIVGTEGARTGDGDDTLVGDAAANVLDGGAGRDVVVGEGGNDVLYGGDGDDRLDGGAGDDVVSGDGGDDVFYETAAANGADDLSGGAGTDLVDYKARSAPLTVSLDGSAGDGERGENDNVRADVEDVWGGYGADVVTGSAAANRLYGFAGNDVVSGGAGSDLLDGGADSDVLLARDSAYDTLVGGDGVDAADRDAGDAVSGVELST